jgi:hypothetical protein
MANVLFTFREEEGITLVLKKEIADQIGLKYGSLFSWITLNVLSALEGVGLTASVSEVLANNNISCNVVAAIHHDHLFIPEKDSQRAIMILETLSQQH